MVFLKTFFVNLITLSNFHLLVFTTLILVFLYLLFRPNRVYLIDFLCYKPPDHLRAPLSTFIEHYERSNRFDQESLDFLTKLHSRSGIGSESYLPVTLHQLPPDLSLAASLNEVKTTLFAMVEEILVKNKVNPKSIDILVVNSGVFCPIPSMTDMVINKFGFRSNMKNFNLTGMGCSAGLLSVDLVKDLLKVHRNQLALVLSMESLSLNGYPGKMKSMLLTNTLFRTGGSAILLSNRRQDKCQAKYVLEHLVRTCMSSDDQAYKCVQQEPDDDGCIGVMLSRNILHVASSAMRINMMALGRSALPYSEQLKFGWSAICQKLWLPAQGKSPYVPDFKKALEHFCIHAGGRAVIDAVEENLGLCKEDVEASRMSFYRFGNTSSASIWYALCYLEAKGKVRRGERIWQLAFGSGFKCNSAVWKCISDLDSNVENPWTDQIHRYPIEVPELLDH